MPPSSDNSIRLRPEMEQLPALMGFLESFAERHECTPADSMALALAGEELFANTVHHGKTVVAGDTVEATLQAQGNELTFTYSDAGVEFDTTLGMGTVAADHTENVAAMPVGGLGLHFIRRTMQEMSYRRKDGRNVTTMIRRLGAGSVAH